MRFDASNSTARSNSSEKRKTPTTSSSFAITVDRFDGAAAGGKFPACTTRPPFSQQSKQNCSPAATPVHSKTTCGESTSRRSESRRKSKIESAPKFARGGERRGAQIGGVDSRRAREPRGGDDQKPERAATDDEHALVFHPPARDRAQGDRQRLGASNVARVGVARDGDALADGGEKELAEQSLHVRAAARAAEIKKIVAQIESPIAAKTAFAAKPRRIDGDDLPATQSAVAARVHFGDRFVSERQRLFDAKRPARAGREIAAIGAANAPGDETQADLPAPRSGLCLPLDSQIARAVKNASEHRYQSHIAPSRKRLIGKDAGA